MRFTKGQREVVSRNRAVMAHTYYRIMNWDLTRCRHKTGRVVDDGVGHFQGMTYVMAAIIQCDGCGQMARWPRDDA